MTTPVNGALSINDAFTYKEGVYEDIVRTSRVYAPILMNHMNRVSKYASKIQWFQQALSQGEVTLASGYTAGDSTITVSAPTNVNPFDTELKPGVSQLRTEDGSLTWDVTAVNSTNTVITVSVSQGTDANVANASKLYIIRKDNIGADFGPQNDISTSSTDINYLTNFSQTISIANPVANGSFKHFGENELSFEQQLENNMPLIIRNIERGLVKGQRVQGNNAKTGSGFTRTSGTDSEAGGIISYINAGGGYTASTSAAISEDVLETDIIELRERGAFTTMSASEREYGITYCDAYISEATLGDLNKLIRLERPPEKTLSSQENGLFGTFSHEYTVNGVRVRFHISDGISDSEVLYIPNKDYIDAQIMRLAEEQPERNDGDNTKKLYTTTYSLCVKAPWILGHRTNLTRL